jgi:hypothetical protein
MPLLQLALMVSCFSAVDEIRMGHHYRMHMGLRGIEMAGGSGMLRLAPCLLGGINTGQYLWVQGSTFQGGLLVVAAW